MSGVAGEAVTVHPASFCVHPQQPWLGASPDGTVQSSRDPDGITEVKCPYLCKDCAISCIICMYDHSIIIALLTVCGLR